MHKKLVHFDTTFNTNPTRNPYNACSLRMATPIKKLKAIALKTAEIPLILPTYGNVQTVQTLPYAITYTVPEYSTGGETTLPYEWSTPQYGFTASQVTFPVTFSLQMRYPLYPLNLATLTESPTLIVNVATLASGASATVTTTSYTVLTGIQNISEVQQSVANFIDTLNTSIRNNLPSGFPFASLTFSYSSKSNVVGIQFGQPIDSTLNVQSCILSDCPLLDVLGAGGKDIVFSGYDVTYLSNPPLYNPMLDPVGTVSIDNSISVTLPKASTYLLADVLNAIQTQLTSRLTPVTVVTPNAYSVDTLSLFSISCSYTANNANPLGGAVLFSLTCQDTTVIQNNFSFSLSPAPIGTIEAATERQLSTLSILPLLGNTGVELTSVNGMNQSTLFGQSPHISQIGTIVATGSIDLTTHVQTDTSLGGLLSYLNACVASTKMVMNPFAFSLSNNHVSVTCTNATPSLLFRTLTKTLTTLGCAGTETPTNGMQTFVNYPKAASSGNSITVSDSISIPSLQLTYGNMTQLLDGINLAIQAHQSTFASTFVPIQPSGTNPSYLPSTVANFSIQFKTNVSGKVEVVFGGKGGYINLFDGRNMSAQPYQLSFSSSSLLTLLGFSASAPIPVVYIGDGEQLLTFPNPYQLSINTYVHMYIQNLPISATTASGLNSTFKIPLSYNNQTLDVSDVVGNQTLNTYFHVEENSFRQNIEITDHNFVLDKVNVSLYDRTGNILNAVPLDWSFTLEVTFES